MDDTRKLVGRLIEEESLILAVFGNLRDKNNPCRKVTIRPVLIKEEVAYQAEYHFEKKVIHENMTSTECESLFERLLSLEYKQLDLFAQDGDYTVLAKDPAAERILRKAPTKVLSDLSHNRERIYILPEGQPCDFLIHLGVMTADGQIVPKHRNKFRQINRFLEIVEDCLPLLPSKPLIIDFGCGKSYLTFAMYYYLNVKNSCDARLIGLDLKEDVIRFCSDAAEALHYENLQFKVGDIAQYKEATTADMVVTLHACDTATDFALIKAVDWEAKVVLSVPCCQHELFSQIANSTQNAVLKHGILKDRFTAILTDALRALKMEECGYDVSMVEFISLEHTAKNVMLRCLKRTGASSEKISRSSRKASDEFTNLCAFWNVQPTIARLSKK